MYETHDRQDVPLSDGYHRVLSVLLWLAVAMGWVVSIFSLIKELCLATACSDAASFTIFGFNMGWFGIAYFSALLMLLWLRKKIYWLDWALSAMVFAGVGSEFRLLWIQKYIIGGWCPLCVTICCALFMSAMILTLEKAMGIWPGQGGVKSLPGWMAFVAVMIITGLTTAIIGVKALI
jgi:hypothetical protein